MKAIMYIMLVAMMSSCIFNNNNTDKIVAKQKEEQTTPPQPDPPKIPADSIVKLSDNFSLTGKYVALSKNKNSDGEHLYIVTLPDTTTIISTAQFYYGKRIESVIIPPSVTKIEEDAFMSCDKLKYITIPPSVTEIGEGAFACCRSLDTLILPNSIKTIGAYAFMGTDLKYIIPPSVKTIGCDAFDWYSGYFTNPKSIDWSATNNFVAENFMVFDKDKTTLLMTLVACGDDYDPHIEIPEGVKIIKQGIFLGYRDYYEVTIPSSVTTIEDDVFAEESLQALYMSKDSPILAKMRRKFGNKIIIN